MNKKVDLFMDEFVKYQIRGGQFKSQAYEQCKLQWPTNIRTRPSKLPSGLLLAH